VSELWAGAAPPIPSSPAAATAAAAAACYCLLIRVGVNGEEGLECQVKMFNGGSAEAPP